MIHRQIFKSWLHFVALSCFVVTLPVSSLQAQHNTSNFNNSFDASNTTVDIDASVNEVKLILGTSRVLRFDYVVPEMVVENKETVQATPISANQILVTGKKLGFSSITVTDTNGNPRTINLHVMGDVRKLEATLKSLFPDSNIHATALNTSVVLQGTAASANQVPIIIRTAQDFFPEVHNSMTVGDSQLVAIEVKVYEVSRTKLRQAGIDWNLVATDFNLTSTAGNVAIPNITFNVLNNGDSLTGFLDLLERNTLAKLLDAPVLVAMNGRPAEFLEGGEIPFQINQGLGAVAVEFRPFGTKLDVVPIVLGHNRVRLEIRAEISEPDSTLASANGTPGFRVRRVNTGVEMKVGHTLALAGDYREEVEAQTSGVPGLKHMPYIGSIFRRVEETRNELELVITMTPRYIAETDPANLPPIGPGQLTSSPSDCELYLNGTIEVPRCEPDCPGPNGLTPAQPPHYTDGNTDLTTNPGLEQRPDQAPEVIRNYQQNFPGTPIGQKNGSQYLPNNYNYNYDTQQATDQNSSWPDNKTNNNQPQVPPVINGNRLNNTIPASNPGNSYWPSKPNTNPAKIPNQSSSWPTRNPHVNNAPAYHVSSRRVNRR